MSTPNEDVIIQNTVAAAIEIIAQNTPLRDKAAKSTFIVSPEHHRRLETVCKVTGKTKQDYYSLALEIFLKQKGYLEDIPVEQVKALAAL